jgi:hypothetical protein
MEKHITVVAAFHIGFSIMGILMAIFVFLLLNIIGIASQESKAQLVLTIVSTGIALFFLILSIPGIIGGIGLFKRRNWARILILVISALNLLNIPFGTALAIYSIWVLVHDETVKIFMKPYPQK